MIFNSSHSEAPSILGARASPGEKLDGIRSVGVGGVEPGSPSSAKPPSPPQAHLHPRPAADSARATGEGRPGTSPGSRPRSRPVRRCSPGWSSPRGGTRSRSGTEAEHELRNALKLDPADISSKYHLAYALIQLQRKDEARALMEEVIRSDPNHADAHYELGKLQLERGEVKAAISNLETGTKLNPDGDHIHYQLAMAYQRESRAADAQREIKVYQELKNRHRGRNDSESP